MNPFAMCLAIATVNCTIGVPASWCGAPHEEPFTPKQKHALREILDVKQPITIQKVEICWDGGSAILEMRDATNRTFSMCKDRRMIPIRRYEKGRIVKPPQLIYWGRGYPDSHSVGCPIGSSLEDAAIAVLKSYVQANLTQSERDSIVTGAWPGQTWHLRPTNKYNAAMCLSIITDLSSQRERISATED